MMRTTTIEYGYRYTTSGGAHRYTCVGAAKINLGDIYLRGVVKGPARLRVTIEVA